MSVIVEILLIFQILLFFLFRGRNSSSGHVMIRTRTRTGARLVWVIQMATPFIDLLRVRWSGGGDGRGHGSCLHQLMVLVELQLLV